MKKMNPEWKEKWIKALRSGEYEQGVNRLKRDGKFCCLGVLCDISGMAEWEGNAYMGNESILPYELAEKMGITPWGDLAFGLTFGLTLTHLNDSGRSFGDIADIIEKEL